jgi:hypothetical protein
MLAREDCRSKQLTADKQGMRFRISGWRANFCLLERSYYVPQAIWYQANRSGEKQSIRGEAKFWQKK